jgi:hypothetical protein
MNEIELKNRFIDFLKDNNNHNFFSKCGDNSNNIIEIRNEGLNKKFDFILALIKPKELNTKKIRNRSIEIDADVKGIFFRNQLLKSISEKYKIKIQNIIVYPIEIKSDKDKLDERLANQIIEAILIFGRSIVILDNDHAVKIKKNGLGKIVPSTIIGYSNEKKEFFLLNDYKRIYSDSLLNIDKINLIKTLESSKVDVNYNDLYRNLRNIQNINQKLIYNKIFNYNLSFFDDEIQFIKNFSDINQKISLKKEIVKLVKESKNYKITEFIS